jgi:hypothetical protein
MCVLEDDDRVAGLDCAVDLMQQPPEKTLSVFLGLTALTVVRCRQQVVVTACLPLDFPQQFPPQRQSVFWSDDPKRSGLTRPSGH